MTMIKRSSLAELVKELLSFEPDALKATFREALQEVLEAEMTECFEAGPSEHGETRSGPDTGLGITAGG